MPGSLCFFFICLFLESFVLNFLALSFFFGSFLTCFSTHKSLAVYLKVFWKRRFSGELGPIKDASKESFKFVRCSRSQICHTVSETVRTQMVRSGKST